MAIADAENDDEDGYGNAVPVEARERLPQALANLAQTARFAHSHTRFLLLYSERRRRKSRDRNDQIKVKTLTISTPDSVQTKGSTLGSIGWCVLDDGGSANPACVTGSGV